MVILQPSAGRSVATTFTPDDFIKVPTLVQKLRAGADLLSVFLQKQIPAALEPDASPDQQLAALVEGFKRVVQMDELLGNPLYKSMKPSLDALALKSREPKGDDLIRLKRLLLEDSFPQELRRIRGKVAMYDFRTGQPLAEPVTHILAVNWRLSHTMETW
jgi:hypothetical protein